MPTLIFQIRNSNDDQIFVVDDLLDPTKNPIFNGPINHGDLSPEISCWQGGNGRGQINIKGSISPSYNKDVYEDTKVLDY